MISSSILYSLFIHSIIHNIQPNILVSQFGVFDRGKMDIVVVDTNTVQAIHVQLSFFRKTTISITIINKKMRHTMSEHKKRLLKWRKDPGNPLKGYFSFRSNVHFFAAQTSICFRSNILSIRSNVPRRMRIPHWKRKQCRSGVGPKSLKFWNKRLDQKSHPEKSNT